MSRQGITLEDVGSIAETILAAGETPTIERIRRVSGSGSNSTISKYLNVWRKQFPPIQQPKALEPLPDLSIKADIDALFENAARHEQVTTKQAQQIEILLNEMKASNAKLSEQNYKLTNEVAILKSFMAGTELELREAKMQLNTVTKERDALLAKTTEQDGSRINYIDKIHSNVDASVDKLEMVTKEAKKLIEILNLKIEKDILSS